jgi:hypothetical protein
MSSKNMFKRIVFLILIGCWLAAAPCFSEIVDCMVAVVNDQVITLTDVRVVDSFKLYEKEIEGKAGNRLYLTLEELINQRVVIDFARENISIPSEELDSALRSLLDRLGGKEVERRLEEFDLDLDDLRAYLEGKLLYQKIISLRFSQSVIISLNEIEDYYQQAYVSSQKQKEIEPKPMMEVLNEIESLLRREKIEKQVALWIRSIRSQVEIEMKYDWLRQKYE